MRSGDHLGDAKNVEFNFLLIAIDRNDFRRIKEEGQIYKRLPQSFQFLTGDSVQYDISKFSEDFTVFTVFFEFERPYN